MYKLIEYDPKNPFLPTREHWQVTDPKRKGRQYISVFKPAEVPHPNKQYTFEKISKLHLKALRFQSHCIHELFFNPKNKYNLNPHIKDYFSDKCWRDLNSYTSLYKHRFYNPYESGQSPMVLSYHYMNLHGEIILIYRDVYFKSMCVLFFCSIKTREKIKENLLVSEKWITTYFSKGMINKVTSDYAFIQMEYDVKQAIAKACPYKTQLTDWR